jgi:hypothetical protein
VAHGLILTARIDPEVVKDVRVWGVEYRLDG